MDGYPIPLLYECYMIHESYLTGVDHPTYQNMMSHYTPDVISCYTGFRNQDIGPCTLSVVSWSKNDDAGMDMLSN